MPHSAPRMTWRTLARGLRFRLTLSYVIFLAILLAGVGFMLKQILEQVMHAQAERALEEEWGAMKGYLVIENRRAIWFFDRDDPEEADIVARLRDVYLLADHDGHVLEVSEKFRAMGVETPETIRKAIAAGRPVTALRESLQGVPYLVRAGVLIDNHDRFYVALGRSLADEQRVIREFRNLYFVLMPVMIFSSIFLGWWVSARAIQPLRDVAAASEALSSKNLSLRIPLRGAGDELDHLIANFNGMVERLEHSFNQTRQFSTDVSHELRTPLTVIRGHLEVALMTAETPEQYQEAITTALADVERLSQTVRALLTLSQAESGQLALQRAPMDLAAAIAEIAEHFQLPAIDQQVTLETALPDECVLEADRVQIQRLLTNLISNAIKYTPKGGKVRVTLRREPEWAHLEVADTGHGIAPDHLPHIFDRFYRTPKAKAGPERGLGLGLSFVAWIVKAHDGTIAVRSRPNEGTSFIVQLPREAKGQGV